MSSWRGKPKLIAILVCIRVVYTRSRSPYTIVAVPHRRTAVVVGPNGLHAAHSSFLSDPRVRLMNAVSSFVWRRPWSPRVELMKALDRSSNRIAQSSRDLLSIVYVHDRTQIEYQNIQGGRGRYQMNERKYMGKVLHWLDTRAKMGNGKGITSPGLFPNGKSPTCEKQGGLKPNATMRIGKDRPALNRHFSFSTPSLTSRGWDGRFWLCFYFPS
jgi:hypothetical protein